jgi:zinc protease
MPGAGRVIIALLVAVLLTACTASRPSLSATPPPHQPRRHFLPNGVTLIVEEHRASDVVALQLWVKAGARDEAPSELGLAHYLEHMVFKGTPARPPGFVDREVERIGGRMNAGTSLDSTYYHTVLPADRVAPGIEMLADIAVNATLDAGLLDNEKSVVLEEMRLWEDSPRRILGTRLYANVFAGHPYGRPVIGRSDLITALTRERLAAFYRRHYVPEAFTLVVVGAVNLDEVVTTARRAFGPLPRSRLERLPPPVPAVPRPRPEEIQRPGTHAYLGLGWLGPRLDHAETPAVDLLVAILGHSRSSRLIRGLRERLALVSAVDAGFVPMEAAGIITITAQTEPGNLARAEAEVMSEIRRLGDGGVTAAELRRAVTGAEAQHEFAMETAEGRATALGRAATVWRLEEELAYVARLHAVTLEQIKLAARRYLDPGRCARVTVTPAPRP